MVELKDRDRHGVLAGASQVHKHSGGSHDPGIEDHCRKGGQAELSDAVVRGSSTQEFCHDFDGRQHVRGVRVTVRAGPTGEWSCQGLYGGSEAELTTAGHTGPIYLEADAE